MVSDSYLTFTEHLEELRWGLLRALAAVIVASLACYFFADAIFAFMVDPLKQILPPGQNLIGTTVTEAFFTEIKVSFLAGVLFSSPFVFHRSLLRNKIDSSEPWRNRLPSIPPIPSFVDIHDGTGGQKSGFQGAPPRSKRAPKQNPAPQN